MTTQRQKRFESSKERKRGSKLIVTKLDGQLIKGELITVKPNSLLLLDTEGKDVSIDIVDIKVLRIVKKSKAGKGALKGLVVGGGGLGLIAGIIDIAGEDHSFIDYVSDSIIVIGLPLALIGAFVGAIEGIDKTIQIEGKSDSEIQEIMDKLGKKARIRDYK
jgi:hypothetical protein